MNINAIRALADERGHSIDEWKAVLRILGDRDDLLSTVASLSDATGRTPTDAAHRLVAVLEFHAGLWHQPAAANLTPTTQAPHEAPATPEEA